MHFTREYPSVSLTTRLGLLGLFVAGLLCLTQPAQALDPVCGDWRIDDGEQCDDGNNVDGDGCSASCTIEIFDEEIFDEGCAPGYWKQAQHFDSWGLGYTPDTPFFDVFKENAFPGKTLLEVLSQGGGDLEALGRHVVAALLNSASNGVDYAVSTPNGVIKMFQIVFPGTNEKYNTTKSIFQVMNEAGCPL